MSTSTSRTRRAAIETEGIVLRRFEFSETSRVVHLLCPDLGRVNAMARGIHRATSSMRGVLDLLSHVRIRVRIDERRDLQQIEKAELLDHHPGARRDLSRWYASLYATELAELAAQPNQRSEALFEALRDALAALCGTADAETILIAFDLAFLDSIGLRPSLSACASCGADCDPKRSRTALFSVSAGGIVCASCRAGASPDGSQPTWAYRQDAPTTDWKRVPSRCLRWCEKLNLRALNPEDGEERGCRAKIRDLLDTFLAHQLERKPRVRRWLRAPARRAPSGPRSSQRSS